MASDLVSALAASKLSEESRVGELADFYARVSALASRLPYSTLKVAFSDFDANVSKLRRLGEQRIASELLFSEWSTAADMRTLCATDGNAHTTLLWLNRGLELVTVMLTKLATSPNRDVSIREVYDATLARHHGDWQRSIVGAISSSTISAAQLDEYLEHPKHLAGCREVFSRHIVAFLMLERRARGEMV